MVCAQFSAPSRSGQAFPRWHPAREEIIENEIKYNNESYRRNYEPIGAAEMMRPISRSLGSLRDRQSDTDLDMPNGLGGRRVVVSIMLFVGHFFLQHAACNRGQGLKRMVYGRFFPHADLLFFGVGSICKMRVMRVNTRKRLSQRRSHLHFP